MEEQVHQTSEVTTKLYPIRWLIISQIAMISLAVRILRGSIGVVNNIYAAYYNLSYSTVDWFTLIQIPGLILANIVLAVMVYFKIIQFRKLSIAMALCLTFMCSCFITAYIYMSLYYLLFIAEFFSGFIYVGVDVASALYSVSWFPESQIGFALSMKEIGGSLGSLLAFVLPSIVLVSPPINSSSLNLSRDAEAWKHSNPDQHDSNWFHVDKIRFVIFSIILLISAMFVLIVFVTFSADKPKLPPSIAQSTVRVESRGNIEPSGFDVANIKLFFSESFRVFSNQVNMQVMVFDGVILGSNFIHKMLMGEIFRNLFLKLSYGEKSNPMSGYVLMMYEIGCFFGNVISGKLCDYFKSYTKQIKICLFACFISMTSVFVGYKFESYETIMVFETLYGVSLATAYTPILESLFQHMHPTDTGFLILINGIMSYILAIIINISGQFILENSGGVSVIIYMSALWFLSFIVSLFFKPNLVRLNIERSQIISNLEETSSTCEDAPLLDTP